jgi:hypothetical protein
MPVILFKLQFCLLSTSLIFSAALDKDMNSQCARGNEKVADISDAEGNCVHDSLIYTWTNNYWKYITTSFYGILILSGHEITLPVLVFLEISYIPS